MSPIRVGNKSNPTSKTNVLNSPKQQSKGRKTQRQSEGRKSTTMNKE